jgi:two-component system KDP operon response regulator KdpE
MNGTAVKVLVADHDAAVRRSLSKSLAAQGYQVAEAATGEEALQRVNEHPVDLVLLDITTPGIGGVEACRRLRLSAPNAGIVILTVSDSEDDKIRGLETGADDYITKPFSLRELVARLRALRRRLAPASPAAGLSFRAGDLELNLNRRTLLRGGQQVHLSPIEFGLISYLMQHANTPIEHGRLLRAVWGPEYGSELEYLRTYMKRLRRKIERNAVRPEYLLTVPWVGYQFRMPSTAVVAGGGNAPYVG